MISIISFLIVIGICVMSHEGGHYWAARFRDVMIHEYSFGMGPVIWSRRKGETQYSFRAFPIGGFVKLEGEDAGEEGEEKPAGYDPKRSLANKKPWERILIIGAGASVNIALAWILTAAYLSGYGIYNMEVPKLGNIMENPPAYSAGLKSGDIIRSIDGRELKNWADIRKNIQDKDKRGDRFDITVERGGEEKHFAIDVPVNKEAGGRLLGVQPSHEKYPLFKALGTAFTYSWKMSVEILSGLWMALTGQIKADVTGPVGIATMAGDAFREGFWTFIAFLGVINLNLGLLNLLPFPALDGGRIIFILVELVTRRKVPERVETMIHYAGFIILLALIFLVTGKDIYRLIQ
ncbi:RIP metalloprotease RseP [Cloacibacillus evryensis]|uniref:RIP metalloprotease RseP n=1 Tax=Cloacibacillus evryensis TaxID=508460 RepID=UPI00241EFE37|nr:RIP metalloprotease RseP [Cloacibacillus evryensis]